MQCYKRHNYLVQHSNKKAACTYTHTLQERNETDMMKLARIMCDKNDDYLADSWQSSSDTALGDSRRLIVLSVRCTLAMLGFVMADDNHRIATPFVEGIGVIITCCANWA